MGAVLGTAQLLSIGLGALFITVIDYRLLVLAMAVVLGAAGSYLLTRREQRLPMEERS